MALMNKKIRLGMDAGTASNRLLKDILFNFVEKEGHKCYRCGQSLTRETFSIEHKIAWMSAVDPVKMFFSLDNIAFSHRFCNTSAAARTRWRHATAKDAADARRLRDRIRMKAKYTPEKRRATYLRTGR